MDCVQKEPEHYKNLWHPLQGNDKDMFEEAHGEFSPKFMTELKKYNFSHLIYLTFLPYKDFLF